ncbi:MAG: helix-turn-helix transcriptional regulator [Bacteroidota bacterium]
MKHPGIPEQRLHREDFTLQHMEEIYDSAKGKTDVPHRHDYYTVLMVLKGEGEHWVDYKPFQITADQVHFVSPGQVHQVALSSRPEGWVITFSPDFLQLNNIPEQFISNINLFRTFGDTPPLELDPETREKLQQLLEEMKRCLPPQMHYRDRALGALLQLFLIHCSNSAFLNPTQLDTEPESEVCVLRDFKQMVDHKFDHWHKVNQYAEALHVSPKHLSQSVKAHIGQTAKELIQGRLTLEAKRLLQHTDQPVKQIAYQLGFEEPLHFSGFFKKQTGQSPSHFRAAISG